MRKAELRDGCSRTPVSPGTPTIRIQTIHLQLVFTLGYFDNKEQDFERKHHNNLASKDRLFVHKLQSY